MMEIHKTQQAASNASRKLISIGLMAMMLYAAPAGAASQPVFSFNGFGTAGVIRSNERNADFIGSVTQPNGAGFTRPWSADVDSKLGLQMSANFAGPLSAVVQVVAEHRYDNSYRPTIEWANLKYQVFPDLDVRLGRTADTLYLQSDLRQVGYAYPWVRRPREIYGLLPVNNKDGIDATYRHDFGRVTNSMQASYGETSFKLSREREVKEKRIFTVADTVEYGASTVRIAYTSLRMTLHTPGLDAFLANFEQFGNTLSVTPGLESNGAQALALFRQYRFSDSPYSVVTVGASHDTGTWLLMAEWARTPTSPAIFPRSTAWYIAGGYRIGKFTPYLTLAKLRADKPPVEPGISTAGLPPPFAAGAVFRNDSLRSVIDGFRFAQKTLSAGMRWDFMKDADLKLQYDRLTIGPGSTGLLGNAQPNFRPGKINLISATVDFIF